MAQKVKKQLIWLCLMWLGLSIQAKENVPGGPRKTGGVAKTAAGCVPSSASAQLDINNVRTLLHNGGDMWWDLVGNPRYEVPKGSGKHSAFAASLWIGGYDQAGQLRVAAQTYRQSGNDFYPGPLKVSPGQNYGPASTDDAICKQWDRMYKITRAEINQFRADFASGTVDFSKYPTIKEWPAMNNDPDFETYLAPFVDFNNNAIYDPETGGDYPKVDGDQAIWWVINDKGNIHTESGGEQIGLEIQVLAFAFVASNQLNDMTFYKQKVINRSTNTIFNTYIGQWVDADLGNYSDDYVGCDTIRGLGYIYNGDNNDETAQGYGTVIPSFGVDFFQGPLADPNDGIDNDKDGIVDEPGERIGMAKFVYYDNDFTPYGNPSSPNHFYQYLTGFWKDGSPMTADGQRGRSPVSSATPKTDYIFPGWPGGPCAAPSGWTEKSAGNPPFDRRFLMSAGPFTLTPGAVNEIVVGAVWAPGSPNDEVASLCKLLKADDIAQALFDNDFQVLNGPDAPDLVINEYDRELLLTWDYSKIGSISNNYFENYSEKDPVLASSVLPPGKSPFFKFQGYIVYQLIDSTVSASELTNTDKARIVLQCDIEDSISTIVNRTSELVAGLSDPVIVDQIMVQGANKGIVRSVRVTEDLFAEGTDKRLVNYRPYYYTIIAYAYNDTSADGRKFVPGNGNFKRYKGTAHKVEFEKFGTRLNSQYGDAPEVTRIQGNGTGNRFLDLKDEVRNNILTGSVNNLVYQSGFAPFDIKVVNPKEVQAKEYMLRLTVDSLVEDRGATQVRADWVLYAKSNNAWQEIYKSTYVYDVATGISNPAPLNGVEKVVNGHGISIAVKNPLDPGNWQTDRTNGFIGASIEYSDPSKPWLSGLEDYETNTIDQWNWILCGNAHKTSGNPNVTEDYGAEGAQAPMQFYRDYKAYDPNEVYEKILDRTWAPYIMTRSYNINTGVVGPRISYGSSTNNNEAFIGDAVTLDKLPNVDIVLTKDKTKWSRCVVIESSPTKSLANAGQGGSHPMTARWAISKDINGNEESSTLDITTQGMSWFPGYAINVETGKRLNILFAEASWYANQNGADMLFNPTASLGSDFNAVGGRHYIYVSNTEYDGCATLAQSLRVGTSNVATGADNGHVFPNVPGVGSVSISSAHNTFAWVTIAMLSDAKYAFKKPEDMPCDVTIKLRVNKKFSNDNPIYIFDTNKLAANLNQTGIAKDALETIRVVPNPYYGRSGTGKYRYENSQIDSRVKITNLPQKCTIKIFTLNGTLVRTFKKDSEVPNIEWDLKNSSGVPVASGVYIIHVDAGELGQKVVKFFGIMPEVDLTAY